MLGTVFINTIDDCINLVDAKIYAEQGHHISEKYKKQLYSAFTHKLISGVTMDQLIQRIQLGITFLGTKPASHRGLFLCDRIGLLSQTRYISDFLIFEKKEGNMTMEFLERLKHDVVNITTALVEKFGKKRLMIASIAIAVLLVGSVSVAAVVTSGKKSTSDAEKVQETSETDTRDDCCKDSTENTVAEETAEETEPEVVTDEDGYTYTDDEKTMYATTTVNVRQKANGESEKLGSLSAGDEVAVTGCCNETGWIRITYNDGVGYVSPDYLSDEKPEVTTTATSTGSGSSSKSSSSSSGSSSTTATSTSSGAYFDSSKARALFDKINADRTSGGASSLTWSDSLYNFAMQRCQAIVSDYSHNGATYGENIYKSYSSDPNEWHTAFRNSSGHYGNYMSTSYNEGAVGAYYYNGCWYICEVFHFDHSSADLVICRTTTSSGIVVCTTQGGEYYCEDGGTDEAHMAAIAEARQLDGN